MDDIVKQAMHKWPHVPHCYGWLGLDARGQWYMRDDPAQRRGTFHSGVLGAKGSCLQHQKLIGFIQRNYACDALGQWFFQNGPQRVYVELEVTPWIWRVSDDGMIEGHDGCSANYQQAYMDEQGWLYLQTHIGFGLVHSQDVQHAAEQLEQGVWSIVEIERQRLPAAFGYVLSPERVHAVSA